MLLAIDTSIGTAVAVVDRDRGVLAELSRTDTRGHAEAIGELIAGCLQESGVAVAALSAVAVGMGPGPFTGLRVGIAAAQAFAFGAAKPVVRVVGHDAIAFAHYSAGGSGPLLVTSDARRRERYWSSYDGVDEWGLPRRVAGPGIARPEELAGPAADASADPDSRSDRAAKASSAVRLGLLAAGTAVAAGSGVDTPAPSADTARPASEDIHRIDAEEVSAASLGLLAERLYEHGRPFAGPEPLYLRSPDVTLAAAPKRVTA